MVNGKCHFTGKPFVRRVSGKILRPGKYCKSGHMSVVLGHGTPRILVHQLVMRTFVGESPKGVEVLYNNGNPQDNRLENLCYGTRTDNILDVYKCEVQIAYAIGVAEPVGINVETFGTEYQDKLFIEQYVCENYDLTPRGIIGSLHLLDVDYNKVSSYGHFGKADLPWEV